MVDLSRREFMIVGSTSMLSLSGDVQYDVDSDLTEEQYEFDGVADLIGPESALPGPDDTFFDNKIAYAYRYEATDTGVRYFKTEDQDDWIQITMNNEDHLGKQSVNSIFGQRQSESRQIHVQNNFRYNIPSDSFRIFSSDESDGISGSGNYGVSTGGGDGGIGFVETGTGTSGSAVVRDRNRVRYRAGSESGVIFTARFTTDPDATLRIGLWDFQDGFFLEHDGSEYRFVNRQSDSDTVRSRSEWHDPLDGDGPSGANIDFTTLSIFRITFGYLGTAPAFLEYYAGPHNGWVLAETIDFTTGITGTNVLNPTLPLQMEATRPSGDGNARVGSGSWMGYSLTNDDTDPGLRVFDEEGRRDSVSTDTDEHIITIQNKETFQGVTNDVQFKPFFLDAIADSGDSTTFYVVRGAVTANTLTFTDRNTANSVVEVAKDATTVDSVDRTIARKKVPAASNQSGPKGGVVDGMEAQRIAPGERVSVYANTPGSPTKFEATIGWKELF